MMTVVLEYVYLSNGNIDAMRLYLNTKLKLDNNLLEISQRYYILRYF